MIRKEIIEIVENVYWIGVRDWNRRLFDGLFTLPKGTSYNAYLVIGSDGEALIDTVNPASKKNLKKNSHSYKAGRNRLYYHESC